MNIADRLQQIRVLLAQDRLVAVLKKWPMATMPTIELNRIPCQKSSHDTGYGRSAGARQQVSMVRYQRPHKAISSRLGQNSTQSGDERIPFRVVAKDLLPLNSSQDNVVTRSRRVNCSFSWHTMVTVAIIRPCQSINE